jgi:pyruvate dehydrogenase E1 component beta subunit
MGLYMHSPGLKIVAPTNPHDAKGLMKTAIRDNNPVMFFIHKKLMGVSGEVPDEEFLVPFGKAQILRGGTDVTVVATSYMSNLAMSAATNLAEQGVAVEVIDPCTLEPLDIDSIVASVKKTGRLVVVDEDVERCGIGAEIGAQVMERAFESLKAPVQRIGNPNLPVPYSSVLEKAVLPSVERIESVVTAILK